MMTWVYIYLYIYVQFNSFNTSKLAYYNCEQIEAQSKQVSKRPLLVGEGKEMIVLTLGTPFLRYSLEIASRWKTRKMQDSSLLFPFCQVSQPYTTSCPMYENSFLHGLSSFLFASHKKINLAQLPMRGRSSIPVESCFQMSSFSKQKKVVKKLEKVNSQYLPSLLFLILSVKTVIWISVV